MKSSRSQFSRAVAVGLVVGATSVPLLRAHAAEEADASARLEKAAADAPDDAVLAFSVAVRRAAAGNADGAFEALERTLANGEGFLPSASMFPRLANDPRFAPLRERFAARLPSRTDGEVVFTLSDRGLAPEGIAYDPAQRVFYVGGVGHKGVYRIVSESVLRPLSGPKDDLDAILGLAIDAQRRRLYAVSTSALGVAPGAQRRNGVKVYDLRTGKLASSVNVPGANQLNDLAIAADGTLLVTDSGGGGVWRIDVDAGKVEPLVPLGGIPGANGIAIPPRGDVAYVAGSRRPVRVDLRNGDVSPLVLPPRENAAAIDGLYWHRDTLIGVQNVTTPARIVRLRLDPQGRAVTAVETLQSHDQAAFDEPTTAAIAPDGLYVLARTQLSLVEPKGKPPDREHELPPLILRVRLE